MRWRRGGGGGWKLNGRRGAGGLLYVYSSSMLTRMGAEWVREVINRGFLPSSFRDTKSQPAAGLTPLCSQSVPPLDVKARNRMAWSSEGPRHSCYTGLSFIVCCLMKIGWTHVAARDTEPPPPSDRTFFSTPSRGKKTGALFPQQTRWLSVRPRAEAANFSCQ